LKTKAFIDSWQDPAKFSSNGTPVNLEESAWVEAESDSPPVTGCSELESLFNPEIEAKTEAETKGEGTQAR